MTLKKAKRKAKRDRHGLGYIEDRPWSDLLTRISSIIRSYLPLLTDD